MTRSGYLLAKWASHLIVFMLIMLVGLVVGAVAQWMRAEDHAFDLVELVKPVFVLALPALAMTAFFAVLFDVLPWLRRTGGNVLYFFVWIFLFVSTIGLIDPDKSSWAHHTWISDPNGLALVIRDIAATLARVAPGLKTSGISIGSNEIVGRPVVFAWSHWNLHALDVLGRALWMAVSMLAVVSFAPILDWAAARTRTGGSERGAHPGRSLRWLDRLLRPLESGSTGMLLAAELKLVLRQRRGWWWLGLTGLWVAQIAGNREVVGIAAIGAWLISVDIFARAILRERETGTGALLFVSAGASRRLLTVRILAALTLACVTIAPALIHMSIVDAPAALALLLTAASVAIGGIAFGVLCRNPRPFELLLVILAYVGVQGGGPLAAIAHPQSAVGMQAIALPALCALLLALWPRFARWR
jgi:hypothetical protein